MPFPGGSKSKVNRAGQCVREGTATSADLSTIDEWRAAHRNVLNTFQAILRTRTRNLPVTVAQRHKRRNTILEKLARFPKMQLSRMDDVAGCRLIFNSIEELHSFRNSVLAARFRHERRNETDKYDYIKRPKITGYRGIHDVYSYDVNSPNGEDFKGLLVEIQYRTLVQHTWATAVEVIGYVTESQPKFEQGDTRYREAMAFASDVLARFYEECKGPHVDLSDAEVVRQFRRYDQELSLLKTLGNLNAIDTEITTKKNTILLITSEGKLEVRSYRDATTAIQMLFEFEEECPGTDVVLVRAETSEEIRLAFKNYFSDATDFVRMVSEACNSLSPKSQSAKKKRRIRRQGQ
ncbi:RelA/SpoT domain-containing protein [Thalassoglobus sp.]|uniref:RelA/SpoT domain-containing protein n=1 Tax=Thalassoglobus sp. TaxID=2795869 RepID=UPI003AA7EA68